MTNLLATRASGPLGVIRAIAPVWSGRKGWRRLALLWRKPARHRVTAPSVRSDPHTNVHHHWQSRLTLTCAVNLFAPIGVRSTTLHQTLRKADPPLRNPAGETSRPIATPRPSIARLAVASPLAQQSAAARQPNAAPSATHLPSARPAALVPSAPRSSPVTPQAKQSRGAPVLPRRVPAAHITPRLPATPQTPRRASLQRERVTLHHTHITASTTHSAPTRRAIAPHAEAGISTPPASRWTRPRPRATADMTWRTPLQPQPQTPASDQPLSRRAVTTHIEHSQPITTLRASAPQAPDMNRVVDEVMRRIERQARVERQRRGG